MIVRAPGKLVLSGAYSVLEGAPAVVTAVTRYAYADSSRRAEFVTPEVRAALGDEVPWFFADELREGQHKLGLGSSAAILVASMVAHDLSAGDGGDWVSIRRGVFPRALHAHRAAQGGGSGLDVAASCFGGTFEYRLGGARPSVEPTQLPPSLVIETWDSGAPASTAELVRRVNDFRSRAPARFHSRMEAQASAAQRAAAALRDGDQGAWVTAIDNQYEALGALGRDAQAPIITKGVSVLAGVAREEGAVVLPSGAGGGDVVLYQGSRSSSDGFRRAAAALGYRLIDLGLGAEGVCGSG